MEREEILRKSRKENKNQDERERMVRIEGESFSLIFAFFMGVILMLWKRTHGLPAADVLAMFWTSCAASRMYRLTKRRNLSDIVTLLISLAFLVWNLVQFFQQG